MNTKNLVCIILLGGAVSTVQAQEVKREVRGEQEYAVYKVQKGETVFSISKKYGISQDKLVENNPAVASVIKAGDMVYVPLKNKVKEMANIYKNPNQAEEEVKISYTKHKVAKGQGLMAIARMYNITYEELKKWNELDSDNPKIVPDQELIVGIATTRSSKKNNETNPKTASNNKSTDRTGDKPVIKKTDNGTKSRGDEVLLHEVKAGETLHSISQMYGLDEVEIMNENNLSTTQVNAGQKLKIVGATKKPEVGKAEQPSEKPANANEPEFIIYTIQTGDGLNKIREKFNVSRTEIRYWNGMPYEHGELSHLNAITAGDPLRIYLPKKIEHVVQKGETIEAIQKQYHLVPSHTPIEKWNNIPAGKLKTVFKEGMTLVILQSIKPIPEGYKEGKVEPMPSLVHPDHKPAVPAKKEEAPMDISQMDKKQHTVAHGQNLSGVAKIYGVTVENIKKWNQLSANELSEGKVLDIYVPKSGANNKPAEQPKKEDTKPNPPATKDNNFKSDNGNNGDLNSMEDLLKPNTEPKKEEPKPKKEEIKEQPKEEAKAEPKNEVMRGGNETPSNSMENVVGKNPYKAQDAKANLTGDLPNAPTKTEQGNEVIETGEIELLEGINSANIYAATHRTAPVNTIVMVTNTINKRSMSVQIVEPLTSPNVKNTTVMQVTRAVLEKLGVGDARTASVEIKYAKK